MDRALAALGIGLVVLLLADPMAGGTPAPPPVPRIESVTHNASGVLKSGDRITVTLRGTPGGAATFHVFGVITDIGMRESRTGVYPARPSVYTGTYIVRPGDAARNAALFATLSLGGQAVTTPSRRPLAMDTRPPVVTARFPAPGVELANLLPNIAAQYNDSIAGVDPASVRLVVNGQNTTARASISDRGVGYIPNDALPAGRARVQLVVADRSGNSGRAEWTFTVAPPGGLIRSVTISPAVPLRAGDVLTVVMTGAPGGRGVFKIGDLAPVTMREARPPGLYLGTYAVSRGQVLIDAPVFVTLEKGGQRRTTAASVRVSILGQPPPAPTVSATSSAVVLGDRTEGRLILRGRSRPGFHILGQVAYVRRGPAGEERGPLGEFTTVVGGDGTWVAAIGPLGPLEGARLQITVAAADPAGQQSTPTAYEIAP